MSKASDTNQQIQKFKFLGNCSVFLKLLFVQTNVAYCAIWYQPPLNINLMFDWNKPSNKYIL